MLLLHFSSVATGVKCSQIAKKNVSPLILLRLQKNHNKQEQRLRYRMARDFLHIIILVTTI